VLRNLIVLLKIWLKKKKDQTICLILQRGMQGDSFIPESWTEVATWVEQIQLVATEITKGKPSRVGCIIQRVKQHHEDHKHKLFLLTPSLLLDPRQQLESNLRESERIRKEKLQARKEKKMARVNPYGKM
jgi:hypothetical protein